MGSLNYQILQLKKLYALGSKDVMDAKIKRLTEFFEKKGPEFQKNIVDALHKQGYNDIADGSSLADVIEWVGKSKTKKKIVLEIITEELKILEI